MMRKNNQGYTLVELLVGITVGALVTLAATTVILMGLRLNRQSMDTTGKQNTARVLLTAMENLATDGSISAYVKGEADSEGDWWVYGDIGEAEALYSYDKEAKTISSRGSLFMKDVLASELNYENGLLTISVETDEGKFESTVYCRMTISPTTDSGSGDDEDQLPEGETVPTPDLESAEDMSAKEKAARLAFVTTLINEYNSDPNNRNIGIIKKAGANQGLYYSQWYIGEENWRQNGWNELTPWCACYVSWAISEVEDYTDYDNTNFRPSFAGVDSFLTYFYLRDDPETTDIKRDYWITADFWKNDDTRAAEGETEQQTRTIYPGDVIFLDWVVNEERNPQHVGVVLYVDETAKTVYTIEGNVAASYEPGGRYGTVGLRQYKLEDPRILGYGVLDWQTGPIDPTPSDS